MPVSALLFFMFFTASFVGTVIREWQKNRPVLEPWKRSWKLSRIFIGSGVFFILLNTFLWRLPALFLFMADFGALVASLVISFDHIKKSWGRAKLMSCIPLFTAVTTTVLFLILMPYVYYGYRDYLFNANYESYEGAVDYALKQQGGDDFRLPRKYRHLSQDGDYLFDVKGQDMNVVFFWRKGFPGEAELLVYSPTGKMLSEYYWVEKKVRDNWYYVMMDLSMPGGQVNG